MPSCSQILAYLKYRYGEAEVHRGQLSNYKSYAYTSWLEGDDHGAINHIINGLGRIIYIFDRLIEWDYPDDNECLLWYYFSNCVDGEAPEEYELTMTKIIQAYIDTPDDIRSAWQLLVDAYQASMYDKPFDMEYHKTWVRRFHEWR